MEGKHSGRSAGFVALFGEGSIKLLTADRAFDGSHWFDFLVENDIRFAIRVPAGPNVRLADGYRGPLGRLASVPGGWRPYNEQAGNPQTGSAFIEDALELR